MYYIVLKENNFFLRFALTEEAALRICIKIHDAGITERLSVIYSSKGTKQRFASIERRYEFIPAQLQEVRS